MEPKEQAFQLHRRLDTVRGGSDPESRADIFLSVLASENLALIRRLPELCPLSPDEQSLVVGWAEQAAASEEVSRRDFVFHLLINCEIEPTLILTLLESHQTFSKSVLSRIEATLLTGEGSVQERAVTLLKESAEELLGSSDIKKRDRGKHMLITSAGASSDWQALAKRLSTSDIIDLRQHVLERFLDECRDMASVNLFAANVATWCLGQLERFRKCDRQEATWAHWVVTCYEHVGDEAKLKSAARAITNHFGRQLPQSLSFRTSKYLPQSKPVSQTNFSWELPRNTTASENEPTPESVDEALRNDWAISKDNGRQVVLTKTGENGKRRSITLYRS